MMPNYNERTYPEILSCVVNPGFCTGCGVCAAHCPTSSIIIKLDAVGSFKPIIGESCKKCNYCGRVCPQLRDCKEHRFTTSNVSTGIDSLGGQKSDLRCYAGHYANSVLRRNSSSGGMLTATLQYVLSKKQIDSVIVISSVDPANGYLFDAKLAYTIDEVLGAAGSKYYPVEFSKVLQRLKSSNSRVGIVGLPCHIRGFRALARESSSYRKNILFMFGLTCGHGVTAHFTDFLLSALKIPLADVTAVKYRDKSNSKKSSDFYFSVSAKSKSVNEKISFARGVYGSAWNRGLFMPTACDYCTDCFAEDADATFMDAWLPDYIKDSKGTSFVISRSKAYNEILQDMESEGLIKKWEVAPQDILKSQEVALHFKRELLPSRLHCLLSLNQNVPDHLRNLATYGSWANISEAKKFIRNRDFCNMVWRQNLPSYLKVKIIMFGTGPSFLNQLKAMLSTFLSERHKKIIKSLIGLKRGPNV